MSALLQADRRGPVAGAAGGRELRLHHETRAGCRSLGGAGARLSLSWERFPEAVVATRAREVRVSRDPGGRVERHAPHLNSESSKLNALASLSPPTPCPGGVPKLDGDTEQVL